MIVVIRSVIETPLKQLQQHSTNYKMSSAKTTPELGELGNLTLMEKHCPEVVMLMELTNSLIRERDELKARVGKLEKIIHKINTQTQIKRTTKTIKRQSRIVKVPGGKLVMNFVLGKQTSNSQRILQETRDFLKTKGERTDGLYIAVNRRDEEVKIWSHSVSALDFMQHQIEGFIVVAACMYELDLPGYPLQAVKDTTEETSDESSSDEFYPLPSGLLDGE